MPCHHLKTIRLNISKYNRVLQLRAILQGDISALDILTVTLKGAMCNKVEYLLTEMQYDIHNYVFSGV